MAIERGHLSVFTKWMLWSDTPVRGRKSTLPNPYFYFVFVSSFPPPPPYTHTYTHSTYYIHTYIHTCIHTYIHTHIHTYTHTHIHTYTHTYIHAYIHTCTLHGHSSLRVYLTGEYVYIHNKKTLFPFLDMPINCSDAII